MKIMTVEKVHSNYATAYDFDSGQLLPGYTLDTPCGDDWLCYHLDYGFLFNNGETIGKSHGSIYAPLTTYSAFYELVKSDVAAAVPFLHQVWTGGRWEDFRAIPEAPTNLYRSRICLESLQ